MITGVAKFEICKADWRAREEFMLQLESEGSLEAEFLLPWAISVLFSQDQPLIG